MSHSTKRPKPKKPYEGFPLFPHASGVWAKKIKGKLHYFGPWADWEAALAKFQREQDYLYRGVAPPPDGKGITVKYLVNVFLTAKQHKVNRGEMQPRSFQSLKTVCGWIVDEFGRERKVEHLTTQDFEALNNRMARTMSAVTRKVEINRIRSVFHFAYHEELIEKPVKFGEGFSAPPKHVLRKAKKANGGRMLQAHEVRTILENAQPQMRAMVLVGLNCAYGNYDVASLCHEHIKGEWADFPRPKTGIERRCWLWPETLEALRSFKRHKYREAKYADLVFLTYRGNPWVRFTDNRWRDSLATVFGELLRELGLHKKGRGFYALRHTFRTIADKIPDRPAIDRVMGHGDESTANEYREYIADSRLHAVSQHVRQWLSGQPCDTPQPRTT
jgi:integrase